MQTASANRANSRWKDDIHINSFTLTFLDLTFYLILISLQVVKLELLKKPWLGEENDKDDGNDDDVVIATTAILP